MRYFNKLASAFCVAAMGMVALTGCEGADIFSINSPDWISSKVDSIKNNKTDSDILFVPNPDELGSADNTTAFWTVFTDDQKVDSGQTYKVKFTNYSNGDANYKNFILVLRNAAKDVEYAVLRADNWGWGTGYTGEESDSHFDKSMESADRDWSAWCKAMKKAKCTATIYNNGMGSADVKITMVGDDGNTYQQNYLNIAIADPDDLYFSFTLEGAHLKFGDVEEVDSDPVAIQLNGIPSEVLDTTSFETFKAGITATVTFGEGVTKDITADDMQIEIIPDFNEVGEKTLVAVYNKTYLGENCATPLIVTKKFAVVKNLSAFTETVAVPTPLVLGAEDNSGAFWSAVTDNNIKVEPMETKVISFTNYCVGTDNWKNFLIILNKENLEEYAVVRADNFGWGNGYAACTAKVEDGRNWDAWPAAMDNAKVTAYITNNGDGTADIKAVMVGNNGNTYTQEYIGINTIDAENLYVRFTIENAHLVFDNIVGATDNSTAFWGAHSTNVHIKANQVCTVNFTNYCAGTDNWKNFIVILNKADLTEYAVVRADNFGWGNGYAACTATFEDGRNWEAWIAAMNGAEVSLQIANKGDGTADIKAVMKGNDGNTYTQSYTGINGIDADDLYFRLTVENAHLVLK